MSGKEIYKKIVKERSEYSQLIGTLFIYLGEELYTLLEKAQKENKKIKVKKDNSEFWDSISADEITFE